MGAKFEILKREGDRRPSENRTARQEKVREALERLRRIGESLPADDAVAVVRDGRDASVRGKR